VNVDQSGKDVEALRLINESTGRNYLNLEEAQKGLSETYRNIGALSDIKDKAMKWDEHQAKKTIKQKVGDANSELYSRVDKMEFLNIHPFAKSVVDEIYSIAQSTGKRMEDVYNSSPVFKQFVENERKSQEASKSQYAEGDRLSPTVKGVSRDDFKNLPYDEQKKVVTKLDAWNKPIPLDNIMPQRFK
jgi:hypothetical protein